ncbi:MAG TPA: hypothetical protein VGD69_30725 [Herpetosiphonaceae bacterium]
MKFMPVTMTHPETALWMYAVPSCITIAIILIMTLLLRGRLLAAVQQLMVHHTARTKAYVHDWALQWVPPIATPGQLLTSCISTLIVVLVVMSYLGPLFVAILLAGPATALMIWGLLVLRERRYRRDLDRALPAAVSRVAAQLAAQNGFQAALDHVTADLPAGPLRQEWMFLIDRIGTPLSNTGLATAASVAAALAAQTPSERHQTLLGHLEVALEQPHDVMVKRVQAAAEALHAAARRQSAAATELSQMKYSGFAVGGAASCMALYLALTQWERFSIAYSGVVGFLVGGLVLAALAAPLIGGVVLARVDDVDY